jgi:hypothetical protein
VQSEVPEEQPVPQVPEEQPLPQVPEEQSVSQVLAALQQPEQVQVESQLPAMHAGSVAHPLVGQL